MPRLTGTRASQNKHDSSGTVRPVGHVRQRGEQARGAVLVYIFGLSSLVLALDQL
jgi:hypothetical protein